MKTKIILIAILLTLLIPSIAYSVDNKVLLQTQQKIEQTLSSMTPSFTNIETTVYFTPSCQDFTSWCSPTRGSCFESTREILEYYPNNQNVQSCVNDRNAGWCCIPQSDRGMYEEIKCQGSGVCEHCQGEFCTQKVYYHDRLSKTQTDSIPLNSKYSRGITSTQTNPTPKWTVAVNTAPGTVGYIPYGTQMYIYFGPGNPWNGIYKAEDTGSAFRGQAKMDIYAGVGASARDEALRAGISGAKPQIYILDSDMNIVQGTRIQSSAPTLGEYKTTYAHTITYTKPKDIFERARNIVMQTNQITNLNQLTDTLQNNNYSICELTEYKEEQELVLQIGDCIKTRSECYCNLKTNKKINITKTEDKFYLNNKSFDIFFNLTYKNETEFELIFEDELFILTNESNSIYTKKDIDELTQEFIDTLENEWMPDTIIQDIIVDVIGFDLFKQVPFVDIATGLLNPTQFATNLVLQQVNMKTLVDGKSLTDIKNTILNPEWLLNEENEESPIRICTPKNIHHMVCDDETDLSFVIRLSNLE
jgi:3D (Asp-Asp-Asp) domain-containing protein